MWSCTAGNGRKAKAIYSFEETLNRGIGVLVIALLITQLWYDCLSIAEEVRGTGDELYKVPGFRASSISGDPWLDSVLAIPITDLLEMDHFPKNRRKVGSGSSLIGAAKDKASHEQMEDVT